MAKPNVIELGEGRAVVHIPILYEDRSVLAIDKPAGWMLAPSSWQKTARNLQLAIESSIVARDFWARSRNLKFLRFVHRLDAETSGILLGVKSAGAVKAYSELFEGREVDKLYLAVVRGIPRQKEWISKLKLAVHAHQPGRVVVDSRNGTPAETHFRVVKVQQSADGGTALVECQPLTGRTHQIRVHLAESGFPVIGDPLYNTTEATPERLTRATRPALALRAIRLAYPDPFSKRRIEIAAPADAFLRQFGFDSSPAA